MLSRVTGRNFFPISMVQLYVALYYITAAVSTKIKVID